MAIASLVLHFGAVGVATLVWDDTAEHLKQQSRSVTMRIELPEPKVEDEPDDPDHQGQIVDIAPVKDPERPNEADYLAEHDQLAPEETKTERYKVNPEVLHHEYSEEQKLQFEDLNPMDATEPSTGAQVGNDRFNPDEDGALASLPSKFRLTNKEGLQRPVPASHAAAAHAGAPNNDMLDLDAARELALNTHKIQFAGYLNRIRRLVNFYWTQNVKNLPLSARATLRRPSYNTSVYVVLTDSGRLEAFEVIRASGSQYMDRAVKQAFEIAGPFPDPPAGLVASDGRVYLPDFEFTVTMSRPQGASRMLDPRAGVQFPGLVKGGP